MRNEKNDMNVNIVNLKKKKIREHTMITIIAIYIRIMQQFIKLTNIILIER